MHSILKFIPVMSFGSISAFMGPKGLFGMLILVFIFLYGMSIGKTRALLSLLSIYVALTLTNLFPFLRELEKQAPANFQPYFVKAGMFLALYIISFIILRSSSLKRLSMGELSIAKVLLVSVLQVGLIAAVIMSFMPEASGIRLLGPLYRFLGSPMALFVWLLGSLAILPLMKHQRER